MILSSITSKIRSFLDTQKLGYVATVSSDGKPNISPKGTIISWSENLLAFADIRSPDTMKNLQNNPFVEINVIDPLSRKGYLFTGTAKIIKNTPLYVEIVNYYRKIGIQSPINSIVIVSISSISVVTSPLYDLGKTEEEIRLKWKKYFNDL
jgi:predicted pyridoxine 5'-phosphate oxidase superfamily flavin-nucleotide-binding protein|tara:strand:- start:135 stop:587 length:453 start_codon:yes stop_codon:yes gene_type:complete